MVTHLVGTDGESASTVISEHLEGLISSDDHIRAVYVTEEEDEEAQHSVNMIAERLGDIATVEAEVIDPGNGGPVVALINEAERIEADQMVVGLRRHSRTKRIIMGSISRSLLDRVRIPIMMVPLPEYQAPQKGPSSDFGWTAR